MILRITLCVLSAFIGFSSLAQPATQPAEDKEAAYRKSIDSRVEKIVDSLNMTDADKRQAVKNDIMQQYFDLRDIHAARDAKVKDPQADDAAKTAAKEEATAKLTALHQQYLAKLGANLSPEQIDKVKDGMTFNVLNVTYNAYCDMIPRLNDEQKAQIKQWLTEARELAMDEGSSDDKHKVFGKYKGRINNYLAKAGFNLKDEEKGWAERRKAAASQPK